MFQQPVIPFGVAAFLFGRKRMYKKIAKTDEMSRDEWLKYRKLGIGGSDAGAICGVNP